MTRTNAPRLWHFTCRHSAMRIGDRGLLRPLADLVPTPIPWTGVLVWLTDDIDATTRSLGLTSHTLDCDRSEVRYRTSGPHQAIHWPALRHQFPTDDVQALERNRSPLTWWVSPKPVGVRVDEVVLL